MPRAALICPNDQLNQELEIALPKVPELELVRVLTAYPTPEELLRTIRVRKMDLLLLSVDELARAEILVKCIDEMLPGFPVITISSRYGVEVLRDLMHLGIREHLTSPIQVSDLIGAVASAARRLNSHPLPGPHPADIYTFLPAKAGVGSSTIAMSTSCALADDFAVKVLLLDADLARRTGLTLRGTPA